jgi:hypothetical protein
MQQENKINVTVRIKPLTKAQQQLKQSLIWTQANETTLVNSKTKEAFHFDKVFSPCESNSQIF